MCRVRNAKAGVKPAEKNIVIDCIEGGREVEKNQGRNSLSVHSEG
jgi:hypothetical protein